VVFRAVASSTRAMCQLLRAISISNKVLVEISEDNIRFTSDHARVMQGEICCAVLLDIVMTTEQV
jgi:cell cycle checkpoint protein